MKFSFLFFLTLFIMANHSLKAQDWANLNKYKEANKKVMALENENRVVFMGNSITEGWSQASISLFKNPNFINRGIGGQTTPQMKARFQQDVIALKPKAVVILAGINDIAQNTGFIEISEIAANIKTMVTKAKEHHIKVIVCSVLPANNFPWRPQINPTEKVIELNTLLQNIATEESVLYLDYYTAMVDDKKGMQAAYTTDGVHCTEAGYKKMELLILPYIEEVLED